MSKERFDPARDIIRDRMFSKKSFIPFYGSYASIRDASRQVGDALDELRAVREAREGVKNAAISPRERFDRAMEGAYSTREEQIVIFTRARRVAQTGICILLGFVVAGLLFGSLMTVLAAITGILLSVAVVYRMTIRLLVLERQELQPFRRLIAKIGGFSGLLAHMCRF